MNGERECAADRCVVVTPVGEPPYNPIPPYDPDKVYPESLFRGCSSRPNPAYAMVRRLLVELGLDRPRYGTREWNPLGEMIQPGQTVFVKPNLVSDVNYATRTGVGDTDCLITHGSVIRAVCDYVAIALHGRGRIVVGDCPIQATDWASVSRLAGLNALEGLYDSVGIRFESRDLRLMRARMTRGRLTEQVLQNDVRAYEEIDLGDASLLGGLSGDWKRFAVSDHDVARMREAHRPGRHVYLLPKLALEADCFINLPKLKFHIKAGLTCALKNLVGLVGHKDYLPHFRMGAPGPHADEYPFKHPLEPLYWGLHHRLWRSYGTTEARVLAPLVRMLGFTIPRGLKWQGAGGWHGNDTLWRTVLDVNRAFFYYDAVRRELTSVPRSRYLVLVDGVVGGEREGPLAPHPRRANCMIGGWNPAVVDAVAASYIGLDYRAIPLVARAFDRVSYPIAGLLPEAIRVHHADREWTFDDWVQQGPRVPFRPSAGWRGHVECAR